MRSRTRFVVVSNQADATEQVGVHATTETLAGSSAPGNLFGKRPMLDPSTPRLSLLALAFAVGTGCSLQLFERTECVADEECAEYLGAGAVCGDMGFCVSGETECTTNEECPDFAVCRQTDFACVSLLSEDCIEVHGDYRAADAFIVGLVSPLTGNDAGTGKSILNAFKMGLDDQEATVNGLPPIEGGAGRRPMAVVACDDQADAPTGVRAAEYLANEIGVPAIVGAAYSGITIAVTTEVTQPAGVMTFSPSATSIAITDLADDGLLWRASPSDVLQAEALGKFTPLLEQQIRTDEMLDDGASIGFVILNKDDAYGSGLALAFEGQLQINGGAALSDSDNYARFNYGNPDDEGQSPTDFPGAVATVLERLPNIVAILGTAESFDLMQQIEAGWDDAAPRPRYLLADAGVQSTLWDEVIGSNDELRRRVQGTIPGVDSAEFNAFKVSYNSEFNDGISSPETFGAAGAYDIAYMLFYAAATLDSLPITGPRLVGAMGRLVGGTPSTVGRNGISTALQTLANGNDLDFGGASGPLDFDLTTGEAPSDVQIWCVPSDASGSAAPAVQSGIAFSAATRELQGTEFGDDCDRQ